MKINTLVIDDNANWRRTIGKFVDMHPLLELVDTCDSAMDAYAKMMVHDIDLLICDIEMPELTGLGLVRSLQNGPLVIFVTSHANYALDCYEVSPVDFLLKPLDPERFLTSIEKVKKRLAVASEPITPAPYFFIRESNNYVQIRYQDVLYMKAQEHFLQIFTRDKSYMPMLSISKMEEQLKGDVFLRVHRSFLVHRSAIAVITKNDLVLTTGETIPIGDQYRAQINRKHINMNVVSRRS
ncbi:LytTR family DNA-binding domain-containing protein [Spirosoma sp.]|uniref:LytR/AlgR family response regulator transcription factor n=1 Tax=Spirosoma sp. TaxID=1899569 RepID=UPI0026192EA0|nr:LytTR family DNA-binding domain-containing protein [Spirosoma sp.]MCX6214692.1 LytTR family DNA-binding domain-containing protein [Spirosoma sp.]